jgi:aminomuconate-semialdehyde/2-hydroxymuconate-6-semialdehyde dehydrogenase
MSIQNIINNQLKSAVSGAFLENINPATNQKIGTLPDSDERDVEAAVEAATAAFPAWSSLNLDARATILQRISDGILKNLDALAEAETADSGKTLVRSRMVEIPRAAENFRFFAAECRIFASESHEMAGEALNFTLRRPIGVVGCISPWNLPLYLFSWKIAPAIAAGNCVIAKPSEITPTTAFLLGKIAIEAGLPPGVLNILHGAGPKCGAAIVAHPKIKAISFTGSTRAGAEIAKIAAPIFKKTSLELGGKNANVIFADCYYDEMLAETVRSSFNNQGQICLCGSRILVEKTIFERFLADFIEKTKKLRVGDPLDESSNLGAIVSDTHFQKILDCLEIARTEGGQIVAGGRQLQLEGRCAEGFFIEPTIITGLDQNCRTNQEEIFGPVVTIQPFSDEKEAILLANSTNYGLSATVWTNDLRRAHRLAGALETGIVWINCWMLRDLRTPFGGVKQSGVGREGGHDAMRFFTEAKNVVVKY